MFKKYLLEESVFSKPCSHQCEIELGVIDLD